MEYRLASVQDLPRLKEMYQKIVARMTADGLAIWDDVYPGAFLAEDIEKDRLYLLADGDVPAAAFALCGESAGQDAVPWADAGAKAVYLDRLGVDPDGLRRGTGSLALARAEETARALGAAYLRLFVVDSNAPAIALYEKYGFTRTAGYFDEVIDASCTLHEYGYELAL